MTQERIAELRKLCEEATEGPWEWIAEDESMLSLGTKGMHIESLVLAAWRCKACIKWLNQDPEKDAEAWERHRCMMPSKADEQFIAEARTALPELLDEIERLTPKAQGYKLTVTIDATAPGAKSGARGMGATVAEAVASLQEQLKGQ